MLFVNSLRLQKNINKNKTEQNKKFEFKVKMHYGPYKYHMRLRGLKLSLFHCQLEHSFYDWQWLRELNHNFWTQ